MTQTVKDSNGTPSKRSRLGQRQQERLQRQIRRRRRTRIWTATAVAVILIVAGSFSAWKYEQYTTQQTEAANKIKNQHATATAAVQGTASARANATASVVANATATVNAQVTATAVARTLLTATSGTPIPKSGPTTPPAITGKVTPKSMAGGVQYIDVKVGTGPEAKQGSTVVVEYTGWLGSTGQKFDSSYDRGAQPFEVKPLGQAQVIPGWNEGLVGMKAGGTRRLLIPPELAYGAQGSPPAIPANATLIFDVTVISVQ